MTIVKGVSYLESVDCVSPSLISDLLDLSRSQSVLIHAIIVCWRLGEPHFARHKVVSLAVDSLNFRMFQRSRSKSFGADLLFAVIEELWVFDNGKNIIRPSESELAVLLQLRFLLSRNVLRDGHRENMSLTVFAGDSVHVQGLDELLLIHECLQWVCPPFCNRVDVFNLLDVIKVQRWQLCKLHFFVRGQLSDE